MITSHTDGRKMLVLVGPPGVGKKLCTLRLNGNHPMDVDIIKTLTTQPQRQVYDALFYTTVSLEEFQEQAAAGQLLEHDEFAGYWYGIARRDAEGVLKQKHGVVSVTPLGVEALRQRGIPLVVAYLRPTSKTLVEENLQRKHESPERLAQLRSASAIFEALPETAYDLTVWVKSLTDAEQELEEKLRAYIELR